MGDQVRIIIVAYTSTVRRHFLKMQSEQIRRNMHVIDVI